MNTRFSYQPSAPTLSSSRYYAQMAITAIVGITACFLVYLAWSLNVILLRDVPVSLHITSSVVLGVIASATVHTLQRLCAMQAAATAADDAIEILPPSVEVSDRERNCKIPDYVGQGQRAVWFGSN